MASHYQITPITPTWRCEASNPRATLPGPKSEIIIKRVTITNLERKTLVSNNNRGCTTKGCIL